MKIPIGLYLLLASRILASDLSVDPIIDRHVEAIGGRDALRTIENLVYTRGLYREGDYQGSGNSAMSVARPWFKLVGDKNRPGGFMEGYDGSAWEWFADPGVVLRTVGAASEATRHYAGVEDPLVDYQDKGSTAEVLGNVQFDGRPTLVIQLTRRDGFVEQFYLDAEDHLIVAKGDEAPIHAFGDAAQQLTRIDDYREVAGVLIAHRFTTVRMPSGEALSSMHWRNIEANVVLPEDWFSPPTFQRDATGRLIEHLYGQRDDLEAMMWTLREFQLAWPETSTVEAVGFVGFQILKMGQAANALALLEGNAGQYPNSASAQYELGRANEAVGNLEDARSCFERALALDPEHARARRAIERLD